MNQEKSNLRGRPSRENLVDNPPLRDTDIEETHRDRLQASRIAMNAPQFAEYGRSDHSVPHPPKRIRADTLGRQIYYGAEVSALLEQNHQSVRGGIDFTPEPSLMIRPETNEPLQQAPQQNTPRRILPSIAEMLGGQDADFEKIMSRHVLTSAPRHQHQHQQQEEQQRGAQLMLRGTPERLVPTFLQLRRQQHIHPQPPALPPSAQDIKKSHPSQIEGPSLVASNELLPGGSSLVKAGSSSTHSSTSERDERTYTEGTTPRPSGSRSYSRRQYWSNEEDEELRALVSKMGAGSWPTLSEQMPGRSSKQCRERWLNHLQPSAQKIPWTPEEDAQILELHSVHGNRWRQLSAYFPGRSDNDIKNRFHVTLRRIQKDQRAQSSSPYSASRDSGPR